MLLTDQDRQQLHRTSEVMLRPFDHASPSEYLQRVARELQTLLGGFAAVCATRDPQGAVSIESGEWSERVLADFARWKLNDEGTRRAIAAGMEVATVRKLVGDDWALYEQDPMVLGWYRPNGVNDAAAYILHWPEDDALVSIELHGRTFGTPRFGDEGEWLLSLLLPSLKAGSRLLFSVGRQRDVLAAEMDALGLSVCVCARDGHVVHESKSLRRLLQRDANGGAVLRRVPVVARAVARTATSAGRGVRPLPPSGVHQIVRTASGRYRLSAALATHGMQLGYSDVLVVVAALGAEPATLEEVGVRFALSKREQDVAALLGAGTRNDDIARRLGISPHTVRRHTERVLAKLGVTNRAEVGGRLRG